MIITFYLYDKIRKLLTITIFFFKGGLNKKLGRTTFPPFQSIRFKPPDKCWCTTRNSIIWTGKGRQIEGGGGTPSPNCYPSFQHKYYKNFWHLWSWHIWLMKITEPYLSWTNSIFAARFDTTGLDSGLLI